jgi:hypothetical protein
VKSLWNRWLRSGHRPLLAHVGRPSPAMIVASVALFVSLSGVSYGVATGFIDSREIKNNEIRSLDIRNNEIRTRDVRNNQMRGIDIRNSTVQGRDVALNTITGTDVNEGSLQRVPSALLAESANTANSAGTVATLKTIPRTVRAEGAPAEVLATHGPFTLRALCVPNATDTQAQLSLQTTEDNSGVVGGDFNFPVLNSDDGEQQIAFLNDPAAGQRTIGLRNIAALAPGGKAFTGQIGIIADAGTSTCTFAGHLALEG